MKTIKLKANAKINLALSITGRRPDGYHELKSVMQSIDLADDVTVTLSAGSGIYLDCGDADIPTDEKNIAFRAAIDFFALTGISGVRTDIAICKRIPYEAGLGGGSADAAAVLLGLDTLLETHLGETELARVGLSLGADVPFCLKGGTMLARGIGEKLEPLPPLPECAIVVVKPPEAVSTAEAYKQFDRVGHIGECETEAVADALRAGDIKSVALKMYNSLECAAPECVERVREKLLYWGALGARMTGSGSAAFGLFVPSDAPRKCVRAFTPPYRAFLCSAEDRGCRTVCVTGDGKAV